MRHFRKWVESMKKERITPKEVLDELNRIIRSDPMRDLAEKLVASYSKEEIWKLLRLPQFSGISEPVRINLENKVGDAFLRIHR